MAIGPCCVVALEGGPGSGKTTTAFAIAARLKSSGIMVEYCEESARRNPFVEDFTLHGVPLSIHIELQLFSATIADQILATRHNQILVCDKTRPVSSRILTFFLEADCRQMTVSYLTR